MALKATELRLRNLVIYRGELLGVHTIMQRDLDLADLNTGGIYPDVPIEDVQPVPLTAEWLMRLKFEKDVVFSKEFEKLKVVGDIVEIQFIHQLQNLYFALTGRELNFTQQGQEKSDS